MSTKGAIGEGAPVSKTKANQETYKKDSEPRTRKRMREMEVEKEVPIPSRGQLRSWELFPLYNHDESTFPNE